jgi:phosphohistidine phosphatase SixA
MKHLLRLAVGSWFLLVLPASHGQGLAKPTHPAHLLLLRHAEKPPEEAMSEHLNEAGKKRAEALAKLFEKSDDRAEPFPKPDFLFASKNTKKSHRPAETIAPLAEKLKLKVNAEFEHTDPAKIATAILGSDKYAGKTVLICWHHGSIGELAKALGAQDPPKWEDAVFDRVWDLSYDEKGKVTFRNRPMQLLPNDSKK